MGAGPLPEGQPAGPAPLAAGEVARYVVAAAVWAPSVHNTQPWRFTAAGQQISLHADAGRQLVVADPDGREMMISCGAALFTARLALRSLGYIPQTSVLPDPGQPLLVARVSWGGGQSAPSSSRRCSARCGSGGRTAAGSTWCRCRRACSPPSARAPHGMVRCCASSPTTGGGPRSPRPLPKLNGRNASTASGSGNWPGGHPAPGSAATDGVPPTSYPARDEHTDPDFPGRDFAHGRGWGLPPLSTAPWPRSAGVVALLTTAR